MKFSVLYLKFLKSLLQASYKLYDITSLLISE